MRGNENDGGRVVALGQPSRHAKAIKLGHRHVEQHEIGGKYLGLLQRQQTVPRSADHIEPADLAAQHLQPFYRQRLVIDDQRAQKRLSHQAAA